MPGTTCAFGVLPAEVLDARGAWADKAAYDAQAAKLVGMFVENFKKYEDGVTPEIRAASPKVQ